jgi:translation initiation factor IF-3
MQVTGEILRVLETKVVGTAGFETRDIHIKTDEQYPQTLNIQFTQGKVVELDKFSPGQKVKIDINLRGREWTNPSGELAVFNTIQGWKIEEVK